MPPAARIRVNSSSLSFLNIPMFNRQVGVWSGPGWSPGRGGGGSGQALPRAPLLHPAATLLLQATFHYTSLKTNRIFVIVGGDCQIHHLIFLL
jgi:hypothetical protein